MYTKQELLEAIRHAAILRACEAKEEEGEGEHVDARTQEDVERITALLEPEQFDRLLAELNAEEQAPRAVTLSALDEGGEPDPEPASPEEATEPIIDSLLAGLRRLGRTAQDELVRYVARSRPHMATVRARKWAERWLPRLAAQLTEASLASLLTGMRALGERLSVETAPPPIPEYVRGSLTPEVWDHAVPGEPAPLVKLPLIHEAVRDLAGRKLLTRPEFDVLSAQARQQAFTVASVESEGVIDVVRRAAEEAISKGLTQEQFQEQVEDQAGAHTFLSPAHAETVFRTAVMQGYSNGQERLLDDGLVGELFPYAEYMATHDARTRPEHLALEVLGIQGGPIYNRSDPVWQTFRPPWGWACRCTWVPLSVREAARRGIREAQEWLARGTPPTRPEWVPMPPFHPGRDFQRVELATELDELIIDLSSVPDDEPETAQPIGGLWREDTGEDGRDLASMYADVLNALEQSGSPADEDAIEELQADLSGSGWGLSFDEESGEWVAEQSGEAELGFTLAAGESPWFHDPSARTQNRWKNRLTGKVRYQKVQPGGEEERAAREARKEQRRQELEARGPVDVGALRDRLARHVDEETPLSLKGRAAGSLGMLRRHHQHLAHARIDELAEKLEDALGRITGEGWKADRQRAGLKMQLARLHHVAGLADAHEQRKAEQEAEEKRKQEEEAAGKAKEAEKQQQQPPPQDTMPPEGAKHEDVGATGGGGGSGRLPAGRPVGEDAASPSVGELPGAGEGTGDRSATVPSDEGSGGGRPARKPRRSRNAAGAGAGAGDAGTPADAGEYARGVGVDGTATSHDGRSAAAAAVEESFAEDPTPDNPTDLSAGNYRYPDGTFTAAGLVAKFDDNIRAIKTLRAIQIEGRDTATPEEQAILAKFVGWGQFPKVFTYNADSDWYKRQQQLKTLLGDEEYEAARASTLNAHYTHPDVVRAHWQAARRLGFNGGKFLETSAGIGYYLGMLPQEIAARTHSSAVEQEPTTGAMLKLLYPKTNVAVQGFEKFQAPNDFYDLVASNVPFGKYGLYDPEYNKHNAKVHDYFFLKSMDKVRPGGLVMHITSTGTMDKPDSKIREALAEQGAELVAAIRFPGSAHKENAGTEVVTDMLIIRKKHPGEQPVSLDETPAEAMPPRTPPPGASEQELEKWSLSPDSRSHFTGTTVDLLGRLYHWVDGKRVPGPDWMQTTTVPDPDGGEPIVVNKYFADHPEQVLGQLDRTGTMYHAGATNVSGVTTDDLTRALGRKVVLRKKSAEEQADEARIASYYTNDENEKIVKLQELETKRGSKYMFEDGSPVAPEEVRRIGKELLGQRMAAAVARLPEGILKKQKAPKERFAPSVMPAPGDVKQGGFAIKDGKVFVRDGGALVEQKVDPKAQARLQGHLDVRDAVRAVINTQLEGKDATAAREHLNAVYDFFVGKHGFLNDKANVKLFSNDPDSHILLALENRDHENKTWTKDRMFYADTVRAAKSIEHADTIEGGFAASLHEFGYLDVDHVARVMGQTPEQVGRLLIGKGLAFEDPSDGWKAADQYLSGNVRRKLTMAQAAARTDPKYQVNVDALLKVQPEDVPYTDVGVKMGAGWIPPGDVRNFVSSLLGGREEVAYVGYVPTTAKWSVAWGSNTSGRQNATRLLDQWSTDDVSFTDVLGAALNGTQITVWDKEEGEKATVNRTATEAANGKVDDMKEAFADWIWLDDERRERLHRFYNDNFNNVRNIQYDGSHQTFPGMNPAINLYDHQKNAVWQVVTTGGGLLAHEVGTGKTKAMIASAMELRRLGLARKPAMACLKANVEAITKEAQELYPGARILSTADMFDAKSRKKTIAKIATGDYDLIIMTHDHLNMLPMRPEVEQKFMREELAEIEAAILEANKNKPKKEDGGRRRGGGGGQGDRVVKQLEDAKNKLKAKLETSLKGGIKDNAVFFEECGIDQLFIDEAHNFKSLPVTTGQNNMKGVPTGRSQKATSMLMRTRWLRENNGGRGVVFATGTPVANTMAELYNMQKYLQPEELKEHGVYAFDAWAKAFGNVKTKSEFTVAGQYKPVSRFSEFTNLPELMGIAWQMMDVQRVDDLKKPDGSPMIVRPRRSDSMTLAPRTAAGDALMKDLQERAKSLSGKSEPGADNMLAICTDGRKGSIDMRLLDGAAPDNPKSKTNLAVAKVLELAKARPGTTQLIFCDVGVNVMKKSKGVAEGVARIGEDTEPPEEEIDENESADVTDVRSAVDALSGSTTGFHLYGDIIDKLVKGGIPREKIADFSKLEGAAKEAAMQAMKTGEILVGIGSTQKLGTGVNVQDRLAAMHHLDVPYVPASLEQRDGRGYRQGNMNDPTKPASEQKVEIHRYVGEGSLDQTFWQIVGTKTNFIKQTLVSAAKGVVARTVRDEDTEELTPEQLMAAASGDPRVLEKVNLDDEYKKLVSARKRHDNDQVKLKDAIRKATQSLPVLEREVQALQADADHVKAQPDGFHFILNGQHIAEYKNGAAALDEWVKANPDTILSRYSSKIIGSYQGFDVVAGNGELSLRSPAGTKHKIGESLSSIAYVVRSIPKRAADAQANAERTKFDVDSMSKNVGKKFSKEDELLRVSTRRKQLEAELADEGKEPGAEGQAPAKQAAQPAPAPAGRGQEAANVAPAPGRVVAGGGATPVQTQANSPVAARPEPVTPLTPVAPPGMRTKAESEENPENPPPAVATVSSTDYNASGGVKPREEAMTHTYTIQQAQGRIDEVVGRTHQEADGAEVHLKKLDGSSDITGITARVKGPDGKWLDSPLAPPQPLPPAAAAQVHKAGKNPADYLAIGRNIFRRPIAEFIGRAYADVHAATGERLAAEKVRRQQNVPGIEELKERQIKEGGAYDAMMAEDSQGVKTIPGTTAKDLRERYPRAALWIQAEQKKYAAHIPETLRAAEKAMAILEEGGDIEEARKALNG